MKYKGLRNKDPIFTQSQLKAFNKFDWNQVIKQF